MEDYTQHANAKRVPVARMWTSRAQPMRACNGKIMSRNRSTNLQPAVCRVIAWRRVSAVRTVTSWPGPQSWPTRWLRLYNRKAASRFPYYIKTAYEKHVYNCTTVPTSWKVTWALEVTESDCDSDCDLSDRADSDSDNGENIVISAFGDRGGSSA